MGLVVRLVVGLHSGTWGDLWWDLTVGLGSGTYGGTYGGTWWDLIVGLGGTCEWT